MLDPALPASELRDAVALGITHLELFVRADSPLLTDEAELQRVSDGIEDAGMTLWSVHAPFGGEVDLSALEELERRASSGIIRSACELAQSLGAKWVIAHAGISAEDPEEAEQRNRQSLRSINCLLAHTSRLGVDLAIEYLPGDKLRLWNHSSDIVAALQILDGRPGVCLDTNHANIREPLEAVIRTLGSHIGTLHISDNNGEHEMHAFPGDGVIDWGSFMEALDEVGYAGPLIYEARMEGDVATHLEMTVRTAREQLGWEPVDAR